MQSFVLRTLENCYYGYNSHSSSYFQSSKKARSPTIWLQEHNSRAEIIFSIINGDFEKCMQQIRDLKISINEPINGNSFFFIKMVNFI